jgi:hypothetical protein
VRLCRVDQLSGGNPQSAQGDLAQIEELRVCLEMQR